MQIPIKDLSKKIKALALDLDGTTLMPNTTLGERTIRVLKELMAKDIQVILSTGRATESSERFRAPIGTEGAMVYFNGAEIVDMPSGKILSATLLNLEVIDFGLDLARSMDVHYQIYLPVGAAEGKWEALMIDKERAESEMYLKHTGIAPKVGDLKKVISAPGLEGCVKAMFITDPEKHDEIRKKLVDRFGSGIYVARTFPTFLEVMNANVSKGEGLKIAMKHRGLTADSVIAIGDEDNDMLMFKAAGFSAAPLNAREHVKAAADYVFGSNAEEGLATFLEEIFG